MNDNELIRTNTDDSELIGQSLQAIRERCKTDLYYLSRYVLGYDKVSETLHRPLCDIVQTVNKDVAFAMGMDTMKHTGIGTGDRLGEWLQYDPDSKERLFMLFRGSFKTTLITICHTIQLILLFPNIRILIYSHKKEGGAVEILFAIKRHFIGNDTFRTLFPEYCPKPNQSGYIEFGTQEKVTVPNRDSSCAWPESTIEIAGMTTDVTGRHYDYIKNDDLVTRDSVSNETMLAKTNETKALQKFLFNQPEWGITDNIGTPYHFNDLYSKLRKAKGITKIIVPALNEEGNPTFPERFSKIGLQKIKDDPSMGSFEFSAQYMMNPVPPEDQTFQPTWFERDGFFYDVLPDALKLYMFVDPAATRAKSSDYTAILLFGIDVKNTVYLVDAMRDKMLPEARTNAVIDMAKKHDLHTIHYEAQGFQTTDSFIINRKCREMNYYITIKEMKTGNANKEDRIRGLQPLYERGDVRWPRKIMYRSTYDGKLYDMVDILMNEMLMFPKCEFDDMVDCHSQFIQVRPIKPTVMKVKEKDDQFQWWQNLSRQKKVGTKKTGTFRPKRSFKELPYKRSWR